MANATKPKPREKKNRPVHELRLGRIRAAIWQNETEHGPRHNVTITRLYKDGEDWKDSSSFGREDLPLVAKVCDQAHSWIYEQSSKGANGHSSPGDDHRGESDEEEVHF